MTHLLLRRDDASEVIVPNAPFNPDDFCAGIISVKRPRRPHLLHQTQMTVAVATRKVDGPEELEMVTVCLNATPQILSQLLADTRHGNGTLNLTEFQTYPTVPHAAKRPEYGARGHMLDDARAKRLAELAAL